MSRLFYTGIVVLPQPSVNHRCPIERSRLGNAGHGTGPAGQVGQVGQVGMRDPARASAAARRVEPRTAFSVTMCRPGGGPRESTDAGNGRGRARIASATITRERQNW
jgi:hypothetical protein